MPTFHLLSEADVKAVLTMEDLIETMASALARFSSRSIEQPVRTVIPIADDAFCLTMPAFARGAGAALGAKLVTVYGSNTAKGLPSHLASIVLLDPETGALRALLDGRYITEVRTAAVSAVSSRLLARKTAKSLAIIGSGIQAHSHLDALMRVHPLAQVSVWSPKKLHRDQFVSAAKNAIEHRDLTPGSDRGSDFRVRPRGQISGSDPGVRPRAWSPSTTPAKPWSEPT